jgi:hypothetical protein
MAADDFRTCARQTFGDAVDSWNEVVLQPLADLGRWFKQQDSTIQWLFATIGAGEGASALAWISKMVGTSAAELVLPILAAFAAGVGIGTALTALGDCAEQL